MRPIPSRFDHVLNGPALILWRAALIWLALIAGETLHGILRVKLLVPATGDLRARQIGVFTGSALIFGIAWLSVRWIRARTTRALLRVGALWLALTLFFEFALGRFLLAYPWSRILADYDPRQGGLLGIGMIFLFVAPLLAARLRGVR